MSNDFPEASLSPLTLLVVDDQPRLRRTMASALRVEGALGDIAQERMVRVLEAETGEDAIALALAEAPELVILDAVLPDQEGITVLKELRRYIDCPVIIVSGLTNESVKLAFFNEGADDYLTKPFAVAELIARVKVLLRRVDHIDRRSSSPESIVRFGEVTVDLATAQVGRKGQLIHLTPKQFAILRLLLLHPGRAISHQEIFERVWGASAGDAEQYVRVFVRELRRKLEADPVRARFIQTVPRVGYRFEPSGRLPTTRPES